MLTSEAIEKTIAAMPAKLRRKREELRAERNPSAGFGVGRAAKIAGVCKSTFYRAELGQINEIGTLIKLIKFLEHVPSAGGKNKWHSWHTTERNTLQRCFLNGETDEQIAKKLHRTPKAIERKRYSLGMIKRPRGTSIERVKS